MGGCSGIFDVVMTYIYIIRAVVGDLWIGPASPCKIGRSDNPEHRLALMTSDCPFELELIAAHPAEDTFEGELRSMATQPMRGEWVLLDQGELDRLSFELKGHSSQYLGIDMDEVVGRRKLEKRWKRNPLLAQLAERVVTETDRASSERGRLVIEFVDKYDDISSRQLYKAIKDLEPGDYGRAGLRVSR